MYWASLVSDSKESAYSVGDLGSIPGLGRSPGEENGNTFHYSCLESTMDGGAWQATVHGVTKSWTFLSFLYICIISGICTQWYYFQLSLLSTSLSKFSSYRDHTETEIMKRQNFMIFLNIYLKTTRKWKKKLWSWEVCSTLPKYLASKNSGLWTLSLGVSVKISSNQ